MTKDPQKGLLDLTQTLPGRPRATLRPNPAELTSGARAGSYVLGDASARGGFAVVYRAQHHETGQSAAVKVLRSDLATSRQMFERFRREAMTIQLIGHPNIVQMFELGEEEGHPFLAMEWLDGHNVEETLAEHGPFSVAEAVALLSELGAALSAAHALGVVHRDVKAQNVMLVPAGGGYTVKLLDFGIAKLLEPAPGAEGITSSSVILGTPLTMAPEQILGQPVDERTDIYALGLLAFQLVTGRLPYSGSSSVEVEEMHLTAPPPRASDLAPVPAAFDALIRRCLAKKSQDRYPNVEAFVRDLRAAASAEVRAATAVVLCAEARFHPDLEDPDDDLFDTAEAVLALVATDTRQAGFAPVLESCNAVLTHRLLPPEPALARAARKDALDTALGLVERVTAHLLHPDLHLALTLHVTGMIDTDGKAQLTDPAAIPSGPYTAERRACAAATSPMLEELREDFHVEPMPGTTLFRVTPLQSSDR
jgi:serine/threonine-protein kinase